MVDLSAAEAAREGAVTGKTHEDQARAWRRFREWCDSVGLIDDYYLENFSRGQRIRLIGAFAMAMRGGRFSGPAYDTLAEGTIRGAVSFVASSFRENDRPNPTKDEDGELGRLLSRQFRAFRNDDPNPVQQKAIPVCVFRELLKNKITESKRAIGQLGGSAFFFAKRSCEYLKVPQSEKRRTDILRMRNIRFFRSGRLLGHLDPQLEYADCVSKTFEWQKKDERMDTVTQMASGDRSLCPVRLDAALVRRIRSYPGTSDDTPMSAVWRNDRIEHITSSEMVEALRAAVGALGEEKLGILMREVGTHSVRSGAAMAMYLGECPVYTIMMIGRWSSDAFLRYIRKQIEQFSHNVSCKMLKFETHRHIPDPQRISHMDPRQRNHKDNAETRKNVGGDLSRRVQLPAFSLFN
jgi:hypothetical protein